MMGSGDSQRAADAAPYVLGDSGGVTGRQVASVQATLQRFARRSGKVPAQIAERRPCVAAHAPVSDSASAHAPARAKPLARKKARELNPMRKARKKAREQNPSRKARRKAREQDPKRKERKRRQHAARRSRQASQPSNVTGATIFS